MSSRLENYVDVVWEAGELEVRKMCVRRDDVDET